VSTVSTIPQIAIDLDGVPVADADMSALEEVVVRRELSLPAQCQLTFVEPCGPMRDTASQLVGATARVRIGEQTAFSGQITAVESEYGPARRLEVRLRCYDLLHRLRLSGRTWTSAPPISRASWPAILALRSSRSIPDRSGGA
jgi:hypothetical protein